MNEILFILLLIQFSLTYSKIIETDNLNLAISEALPGDTILLKAGIYSSIPYNLKSGEEGKLITIKAIDGDSVMFIGNKESSSCIFELNEISYISIEGPFELKDAFCGIKAMDVSNIKISGLTIHDTQQHALVISGENNGISNNEIFNCVLENKESSKNITYGWSKCVEIRGKHNNSYFSNNILLNNNNIHNTWGEGLYFQKCDICSAVGNNITNAFSMNMYIDKSKNIIINRNILRVNSDEHDSHLGNACGIGLSSEGGNINILDNIIIQNNIIIGTRIAIYFFQRGFSGYNKIKILHNTIWYISVTSLYFENPSNSPLDCELRNNLIYIDNWIADFYPKKSWTIGNNYFYNYSKVPNEYKDTDGESKAIQDLDFDKIFNNRFNNCNYYDKNIDIECFRPSTVPDDSFNLYHNGSKSTIIENKDYSGCIRDDTNPTIGAFEFFRLCLEYDVQLKFIINYNTKANGDIGLTGSLWSWKNIVQFNYEDENNWTYLFTHPPEYFEYKFVHVIGNEIKTWENGGNRKFNLNDLVKKIKLNYKGEYENCQYEKNQNIVILECFWK